MMVSHDGSGVSQELAVIIGLFEVVWWLIMLAAGIGIRIGPFYLSSR